MVIMNKRHLEKVLAYPAVLLLFALASCTQPAVVTDILMSYPPTVEPDAVVVYEEGQQVPPGAMSIGRVAVVDRGTSHHCKYDQVLALAKKKTAELGGDALRIEEHTTPSLWHGTCHQIIGSMLITGKVDIDSLDFSTMARNELQQSELMMRRVNKASGPANAVKVEAGPGFIVSTVETPVGRYNSRVGTDFMVSYQHIWKSCFGVGFTYAHNATGYNSLGTLKIDYVGADWVYSQLFGKKKNWRYDWSLGIGYAHYSIEGWEKQGGVGVRWGAGLQYMLSKRIGLGLEFNSITTNFKKPDGVELEKNQNYGYQRINLLGGLHFYF